MARLGQMIGAFAVLLALVSCTEIDGEPATPEEAEAKLAADQPPLPPKVSVLHIETLELGRLYKGYMLTAFGVAPAGGYYQPELRIRYGGQPAADGFYEFDFIARPPKDSTELVNVPESARQLRADYALPMETLRGAAGVRVWSSSDSMEGRF